MRFVGVVDGGKGSPGLTDDDILESLIVSGVLAAVTVDGMLLGDEQGNILMM